MVATDLSDLERSRVQRPLLFQIALFFIDNRNSVLCGIPILQLHLQHELVKQTKNMRLVEFNNHLDEFHRLKGLNLQEQVYSSVCLLIALYQILTHRAFLSLPAEPDGATHMQRLSDINIFNMHFLYYISSLQNMTPCWSAARKPTVSCSCRLIVTETPPMPATTCKHHLCCSRKAEEETKKKKARGSKQSAEGDFSCIHGCQKTYITTYKKAKHSYPSIGFVSGGGGFW